MRKFTSLVAASAIGVCAAGANAATVTFNLQSPDRGNHDSLSASFSMTQGGVTGNFDSRSSINTWGRDGRISRRAGDDSRQSADGKAWHDLLQIRLSHAALIRSISFGPDSSVDFFRILTDTTGDGAIGGNDHHSAIYQVKRHGTHTGFGGVRARSFAVAAYGQKGGSGLKSLTVETEEGAAAVVPLPAAGWLLLGALGGLSVLRRRKG